MYSVLLNSKNEEYSFDTFYTKFLQICKEHKDTNRALAFAFILYDFENAQISKVLKDPDYWLSLNTISGNYLTVFSINYSQDINFIEAPTFPNMVSSFDSENPSKSSNSLIEKYFGRNIEIRYPTVMFFQIHKNKIIDYSLIQLDQQEIEPAFIELKNYISKAVEALKKITAENKQNSEEIFQLINDQVKGLRAKIVAKKTFKKVTYLVELASAIINLRI